MAIELAIERNNQTSRANDAEGGIGHMHDGDDIHEAQIEGTQRDTRGGTIGASANQANDTSTIRNKWNQKSKYY